MTRARILRLAALVLVCAAAGTGLHFALSGRSLAIPFGGAVLSLEAPQRLAWLAALPLIAAAQAWAVTQESALRRRVSAGLRAALLLCLVVALARPQRLSQTRATHVVFAVDVSDSLDRATFERARGLVERARRGRAAVDVLTFDGAAKRVDPGARIARPDRDDPSRAHTDLQSALQRAYGLAQDGRALRVVFVTDGKQTRGDLLAEAARAAHLGVEIDVRLLSGPPPPEVGVRALLPPAAVDAGRPFHLRAELFATRPTQVELRLFRDEDAEPLAVRRLQLQTFEQHADFQAVAYVTGPVHYRVELTPLGPDRFSANNRAETAAWVRGRARVLMLDSEPQRLAQAARALEPYGFDVQVRSPTGMPRSAAELSGFDFLVLSDVPASQLPGAAFGLIEHYVHDLGGGFLMAGGPHSFGLGGYQNTRLRRVLPVRLLGETRLDEPALALALLIDCSGSMAGPKIELAKDAARAALEVLGEPDLIEVIGFAGEPERTVRMQSTRNRAAIAQSIARLAAQGGTQLFPALDLAYQDLATSRAKRKHVILLTDGQTEESGIADIVEAMRNEAISISTVGLGRDVNRNLLQGIASRGGGRAYFTDDPQNIPRIFVHETTAQKRNSAAEQATRLLPREPADCLKGLDFSQAPPVLGYVVTQPKPAPAQVLLAAQDGEPLLSRVRYGLGYALAFTPDLKARWSASLLSWDAFGQFFAQLVREHQRKPEDAGLALQVEVHEDRATAWLDAIARDGGFVHDLHCQVELADHSGRPTDMPEVAPGRYQARLELPGFGGFVLRADCTRAGRLYARAHAAAEYPYPREYAPVDSGTDLIARAAELTGGRVLTGELSPAFRPAARPLKIRSELWPYLDWVALALLLLDLLVRRLAPAIRAR